MPKALVLLAALPLLACGRSDVGVPAVVLGTAPSEPSCEVWRSWFPDDDGDGYGDALAMPVIACEPPPGHVPDNTDCADHDDRARPRQTTWQGSPIVGPRTGPAFDFNCTGLETFETPDGVACGEVGPSGVQRCL